jgi:hypothetical protein
VKRETRDKFASGTNRADLTTGNACWETAPLVFEQLNEDFGPFDIDLTADEQRHLCPVWLGPDSPFGPGGFDALNCNALDDPQCIGDWSAFMVDNGYSNPPYGPFVGKMLAAAKANAKHCDFTSTLLLPMRVTKAFKAHVLDGASDLIFPDRRLTFFENGVPRKIRADPALFDSILVRYAPGAPSSPRLSVWKVPTHVTPDDLARAEVRLRRVA